MSLSNDLISQFVKATNDNKKTKNNTTVFGTVVDYNGGKYVKIDGSDLLTPVISTSHIEDEERVIVTVNNHTAIVTGNISSPSASVGDVENVGNKISEFEIVIADKVSTKEFDAQSARIDSLQADNVTIKEKLTANAADITKLSADNATIRDTLTANVADIDKLKAENATITGKLKAVDADIESLQADNVVIRNELTVKYATIESLDALSARVDKITSTDITTEYLDAHYAQLDFVNVNTAKIKQGFLENLMVSQGVIADRVVGSEVVATDVLTGVKIYADDIIAGTLSVERLILRGSKDSLVYALNNSGGLESTTVNTLDGSLITEKTITAKHIVADSITSTEIDVEDLIATGLIETNKLTAKNVDVSDLFAQNIIASGSIQSSNYVAGTSGMRLNMSTGAWDSKYFKIDSIGAITATSGNIAGWSVASARMQKNTDVASGVATTQYRVCLDAPISPKATTGAFYIQARTYDGGSTYGNWTTKFNVRYDGSMYAIGGGQIGGWVIGAGNSGAIYKGTDSKTSTTKGIYVGPDAIRAYTNENAYTHIEDGRLSCIGASIKGDIHCTGSFYLYSTAYDRDWEVLSVDFSPEDNQLIMKDLYGQAFLEYHEDSGLRLGTFNTSTIYASDWFRSTGTTGWYNQTYGGGWYMSDKAWIRAYGSKGVYLSNTMRIDLASANQVYNLLIANGRSLGFRNDGSSFWMLVSDTPDSYFNSLRPFSINLATGAVTMQNGYNTSDGRLKTNVVSLDDDRCYEFIKRLEPVEFSWKNSSPGKHFGFIAQEVKNVMNDLGLNPKEYELVIETQHLKNGNGDDMDTELALGYNELIAPIISTLQKIIHDIDTLKGEN